MRAGRRSVGDLLGLDKLAWSSVLPEFDPFKYNSFAVNAGEQAYRMTQKMRTRLDRLAQDGRLGEVAPILAFQSAVDATVIANAVVTGLFARLPPGEHTSSSSSTSTASTRRRG